MKGVAVRGCSTTRGVCALVILMLGTGSLAQSAESEDGFELNGLFDEVQAMEPPVVESEADEPAELQAPSEPAAGRVQRPKSRLIEEIVVTAQKREESLQDVPISVSAFSAGALDARGITNTLDLPLLTPGLTVSQQVGYTTVYLRGVGSDAFVMADPSVALYIDNVYIPSAQGMAENFGAVERIEVLKGPQGTLFGRNAVGGAINIITKTPQLDEGSASIRIVGASRDTLKAQARANLPVSSTLALAVSGFVDGGEYHQQGLVAGMPTPDSASRGGRLKLLWAPNDSFELGLTGYRLRQQGIGTFLQLNRAPSPLGRISGIEAQLGYDGEVDAPGFFDSTNTILSAQMQLYTDAFDLRLMASDQLLDTAALLDFDGSPRPLVAFSTPSLFSDVQTAEIQILSNDDSWGSDWLQWIGGAYWFKSQQGYGQVDLSVSGLALDGSEAGAVSLPDPLYSLLEQALAPLGVSPPNGRLLLNGLIDTESVAAFAQTTVDFSDWFGLTLGLRYQIEKRGIAESKSGVANADGTSTTLFDFQGGVDAQGNAVPPTDTTRSLKPKISLNFRPLSDDSLLYMSYQQALKSATYNVLTIYTQPDYVEPEETTAWEFGIKTHFFDGLLSLNAAAFLYEIENLQVQYVAMLQGGAVSFENAGSARVRGVDFDTTLLLLPQLMDNLVLTLGGAYLDATYTDYQNGTGFDPNTGIVSQNNDYTGNNIVRTPEFSGTLSLGKTWVLGGNELELAGDVYTTTEYNFAADQDDDTLQDGYTLFGVRISYLHSAWDMRMTLLGRNVSNVQYMNGAFPNDFGVPASLAPPATWELRMDWEF